MKSLQDYIDDYRGVVNNLELSGDSVEVLVQLLAHYSYMSEMEYMNITNEASLERASLTNSKIQLCVDRMYSVFRGTCPRVKLRFTPMRYLKLKKFDKIYSSGGVNLYYDGDPITIPPSSKSQNYVTISCILAKEVITDEKIFNESNRYYVDFYDADVTNDGYVKVNDNIVPTYRKFSDHIRYGGLFDLTLPDYGMRLYGPDIFRSTNEVYSMNSDEVLPSPNTKVEINMFKYCSLSDFSNLDKIKLDGTEMPTEEEMLESENYPGITLYAESERDSLISIHYKANRDRYSNSIIRSNLDIGVLLEEELPSKVLKGGTVYEFDRESLTLDIYYIPYSEENLITTEDVEQFNKNNKAYYVAEKINVYPGKKVTVQFDINIELYQNKRMDDDVEKILKEYEDKFNIDLEDKIGEIEAAIAKLSNVRSILRVRESDGSVSSGVKVYEIDEDGNRIPYVPEKTKYCKVDFNLISEIYKREI